MASKESAPERKEYHHANSHHESAQLHHRQVEIEGISIHLVEGGAVEHPILLFLHGWPESWAMFEQIMKPLSTEAHGGAIDLPGVGASEMPPTAHDKRTLARYIQGMLTQMHLRRVMLVGHDIGGMIVYAYLHAYPETLQRAVIMNVVIPGLEPWSDVIRNPHISGTLPSTPSPHCLKHWSRAGMPHTSTTSTINSPGRVG